MADEKPEVLQDQTFVVQEGLLYRAFRTGSILANKLFFAALILWGIWLLLAYTGRVEGCVNTVATATNSTNDLVDTGTADTCNALLTPTSLYLGAMSILAFIVSIGFGLLGLVVGKKILAATPAAEEVGAGAAVAKDDEKNG